MYSILIVEDSRLIIRDLKRILQSSGYQIEIFEAFNGKEALDVLEYIQPDIIFSDIKMKIMDGLSFVQNAKELYPSTKFVIISGYSDFEFTHEALRLQVDDYIVKPVEDMQLISILKRLIGEIESKRREKEEIIIENAILNHSEVSIPFFPPKYILSIVIIGFVHEYSPFISCNEIKDLISDCIEENNTWIVNSKAGNEKIIIYNSDALSLEKINLLNTKIFDGLIKNFERVNLISSGVSEQSLPFRSKYETLHYQLMRRVKFDSNNIFLETDATSFYQQYILQKEQISSFEKKIGQLLKMKRKEEFNKLLHSQIELWKKDGITLALLRKYVISILEELFVVTCGIDHPSDDPVIIADRMLNSISSFPLFEQQLIEYSNNIWDAQDDKVIVSTEQIKNIVSFMSDHLYDNICLQEITDLLGLSSSYICRIFKIYYNDTPISFYNQLKIQEAKRIIENHTGTKIKDIADMLGFNDQYYFSKVFKQQYGMSPSVFRAQITGVTEE